MCGVHLDRCCWCQSDGLTLIPEQLALLEVSGLELRLAPGWRVEACYLGGRLAYSSRWGEVQSHPGPLPSPLPAPYPRGRARLRALPVKLGERTVKESESGRRRNW